MASMSHIPNGIGVLAMIIAIRREDAELVRDLLRQKIVDLDKEINRTDSREFKHTLQELDRDYERVLGEFATALER
jgi:hypothetical protein